MSSIFLPFLNGNIVFFFTHESIEHFLTQMKEKGKKEISTEGKIYTFSHPSHRQFLWSQSKEHHLTHNSQTGALQHNPGCFLHHLAFQNSSWHNLDKVHSKMMMGIEALDFHPTINVFLQLLLHSTQSTDRHFQQACKKQSQSNMCKCDKSAEICVQLFTTWRNTLLSIFPCPGAFCLSIRESQPSVRMWIS